MQFSPRISAYSEDAASLGELLGLFRSECLDYLEGRLSFPEGYDNGKGREWALPDGRLCVTQFPHGHPETARCLIVPGPCGDAKAGEEEQEEEKEGDGQQAATRQLYFVGFFSRRRPGPPDLADQVFKVSADLMDSLRDQPDIWLYGYGQVTTPGHDGLTDYYNLAVIRNEEGGQKWRNTELHAREAVNNLSPKYYTTVRIHTGVLPDGLDSTEFLLKRSVFLDYRDHQKDATAPIHREEKLWTN